MRVFFYGLFMDEALLGDKGIVPTGVRQGRVDGYALQIGDRATLVQRPGARAFGLVMDVTADGVETLYSGEGLADYRPETVTVELGNGSRTEAVCYNLPASRLAGRNENYAKSLLELATRIGLPADYLDEIRRFVD